MSDTEHKERQSRSRQHRDGLTSRGKFYRGFLLSLLVVLFAISIMLPRIIVLIPVGHAGVLFETLSGGIEHHRKPLPEGLHLKWPWNTVTTYDLRTQRTNQSYGVIASNGLHFKADISFRYRPCYNNLTHLHQDVGPEYLDALLVPEVEALVREVIALCQPEEIISSERSDIQEIILTQLKREFSHGNIAGEGKNTPNNCSFPEDLGGETPFQLKADRKQPPAQPPSAQPKKLPLTVLSESHDLRKQAYSRELDNARKTLAPEYLSILQQADVLSADEDLEKFYTVEEDESEICGFTKKDIKRRMQSLHNDITTNARGVNSTEDSGDLFYIQDVLIRSIELPKLVRDAIERKVEQEHLLREYRFRVKRELMESLRKEAEAEGIKSFDRVTGGNISENYLRWRGIDATVKLSTSPNSKLVILGGGKDRLPIILNPENFGDQRPPTNPPSTVRAGSDVQIPGAGAPTVKPDAAAQKPVGTPPVTPDQ